VVGRVVHSIDTDGVDTQLLEFDNISVAGIAIRDGIDEV
jgi:hypothetical protein